MVGDGVMVGVWVRVGCAVGDGVIVQVGISTGAGDASLFVLAVTGTLVCSCIRGGVDTALRICTPINKIMVASKAMTMNSSMVCSFAI